MILKFVMRDKDGAVVSGTPTVTADGIELTPTATGGGWQVDAPLGSIVSATLTGALPLDVMMSSVDPTLLSTLDAGDLPTDYAKPADVQVTVPEPVFAGTVTFSGTVEAPAVTVNPTLTPEESAKLMGAAQEATLEEVAGAVAALPTAPVGTRIDQTSEDASGAALGLATPGSSITAYLASDTERADPKRHTTAATDGTWALYLSAGTYVLVVALDGYYDAADGDSIIERTVVVP